MLRRWPFCINRYLFVFFKLVSPKAEDCVRFTVYLRIALDSDLLVWASQVLGLQVCAMRPDLCSSSDQTQDVLTLPTGLSPQPCFIWEVGEAVELYRRGWTWILQVLQPQPSECWNYMWLPPCFSENSYLEEIIFLNFTENYKYAEVLTHNMLSLDFIFNPKTYFKIFSFFFFCGCMCHIVCVAIRR